MQRTLDTLASLAAVLALTAVPALAAEPAGVGKPASAKVQTTKTTPASMKSPGPKGASKSAAPKSDAAKGPKGTTPATSTASTTPGTAAPGTPTWTPTNPVAQKLSTKPNLLARVKGLLPAGTDLNAATAGFKNFGQFVAATNVSSHLGIDFAALKAKMTGIDMNGVPTGQPTLSLGKAIQTLKPGVDGTAEAQRAESLASQQIASGGAQ